MCSQKGRKDNLSFRILYLKLESVFDICYLGVNFGSVINKIFMN